MAVNAPATSPLTSEQLAQLFEQPIVAQEFRKTSQKEAFLASLPAELDGSLRHDVRSSEKGAGPDRRHRGESRDLPDTFSARLLTTEEERFLFRRLNYAKFLGSELVRKRDLPRKTEQFELQRLAKIVLSTKEVIVECNLRLVVSIAKRFVNDNYPLAELVSDGNWTLLKAAEKFDYSQGNRFSTYATHAIQRAFFRLLMKRKNEIASACRGVEFETMELEEPEPDQGAAREVQLVQGFAEIQRVLPLLDERERVVIEERFALNGQPKVSTFRKIGLKLGVCKERVRQIQSKAMDKLRQLIHPSISELMVAET